MIPAAVDPFGPAVTAARDADPVVRRYRAFFALLDWERVPERDPTCPWPGSPPPPVAAYVKTLLVKLGEGKPFVTQLRAFLVEHPLLVLEVGFRPALNPAHPFGFDPERTVPGARWLRHQQHALDPSVLGALLAGTVTAVMRELPDLGTTVAVDVKHLYAWVRENNPKEGLPPRFDPARQPRGDPDCRLGAKGRANRDPVSGRAAPTKERLGGYGAGIAAATDPRHGDVILAEWTQAFNHQDVTWFHPVYDRAVAALGRRPANLTADAAFDAWHVHQTCAAQGGIAAIPRNDRGHAPQRSQDGHPVCDRGLPMAPARRFRHEDGFQAQHYRCPLLWPARAGERCGHAQFAKGPGCTKHVNLEAGGRMRAELDRASEAYRALYRQRTCAERINSQATALGIERLKVRRAAAMRRLATLTYIVINVRALQRIHAAIHAPPVMLRPTLPKLGEGLGVRAFPSSIGFNQRILDPGRSRDRISSDCRSMRSDRNHGAHERCQTFSRGAVDLDLAAVHAHDPDALRSSGVDHQRELRPVRRPGEIAGVSKRLFALFLT